MSPTLVALTLVSFPCRAKLVKLICTPAKSVYSERFFSENSNIFDEKGSRLLPTRGEILLFIHHNGNKINMVYDVKINSYKKNLTNK